jgi:hypothetical protein
VLTGGIGDRAPDHDQEREEREGRGLAAYGPRPVGQEPTATLPVTKSLVRHEKGAVITASGSELTNDTLPFDSETEDSPPTPGASPEEL